MARQSQEERILNMPIDVVVQKMRNVGAEYNFALRSENPIPNAGVWFRVHHGASFTSWGEKITVTLTPMGQQTRVHIHSECGMPTQIIDYGKNAQVVKYLFEYLYRPTPGVPVPQQVPPQNIQQTPPVQQTQQQNVQQPAPMPQAQPQPMPAQQDQQTPAAVQPRFCTKCGSPVNTPNALFCTKCGNKL